MRRSTHPLSRRAFVRGGSLVLLGTAAVDLQAAAEEEDRVVRVGLVTDLHHADKPAHGTRHYRDTLAKLGEAANCFASKEKPDEQPDFVVELGDFIDAAEDVETELDYLRQVSAVFNTMPGPKHHVLGNHCVDMLTKDEFLSGVGQTESFYSFDSGGIHFVVLDSCFRTDGVPYGRKNSRWDDANVPGDERDWLRADLEKGDAPVIVFAHQRLDDGKSHAVKNAADVRKLLEASGRVRLVLQGHAHKNDHQEIAGIHYVTLVAMVEGASPDENGYSIMDVMREGSIRITGFRKQKNYDWG